MSFIVLEDFVNAFTDGLIDNFTSNDDLTLSEMKFDKNKTYTTLEKIAETNKNCFIGNNEFIKKQVDLLNFLLKENGYIYVNVFADRNKLKKTFKVDDLFRIAFIDTVGVDINKFKLNVDKGELFFCKKFSAENFNSAEFCKYFAKFNLTPIIRFDRLKKMYGQPYDEDDVWRKFYKEIIRMNRGVNNQQSDLKLCNFLKNGVELIKSHRDVISNISRLNDKYNLIATLYMNKVFGDQMCNSIEKCFKDYENFIYDYRGDINILFNIKQLMFENLIYKCKNGHMDNMSVVEEEKLNDSDFLLSHFLNTATIKEDEIQMVVNYLSNLLSHLVNCKVREIGKDDTRSDYEKSIGKMLKCYFSNDFFKSCSYYLHYNEKYYKAISNAFADVIKNESYPESARDVMHNSAHEFIRYFGQPNIKLLNGSREFYSVNILDEMGELGFKNMSVNKMKFINSLSKDTKISSDINNYFCPVNGGELFLMNGYFNSRFNFYSELIDCLLKSHGSDLEVIAVNSKEWGCIHFYKEKDISNKRLEIIVADVFEFLRESIKNAVEKFDNLNKDTVYVKFERNFLEDWVMFLDNKRKLKMSESKLGIV